MGIPGPLAEALLLGRLLIAQVPASAAYRLAGVIILPHRDERDRRAQVEGRTPRLCDRRYLVLWREYSRRHMENDWDMVPGDGIWELKRTEVLGLQDLEDLLRSWSVSLASLTYPWNTEIPE